MTPATRTLIGVCVVAVLGAGVAGYFLTNRPAPPAKTQMAQSPAGQIAPLPAGHPAQQQPPSSEPAVAQSVGTPLGQFTPFVQDFSLVRDSAAYTAASLTAPQLYTLKAGTPVESVSQSPDHAWIIAMTQDGQAACIPAADLGPYDPARVPKPESINGPAKVVDTGTLDVGGQQVGLAGVTGQTDADLASKVQAFIDRVGGDASCKPSGAGYICTLQDGTDVARMALFNGAAQAAPDASVDYKAQESAAKDGHKGMWK